MKRKLGRPPDKKSYKNLELVEIEKNGKKQKMWKQLKLK